MKTKTKGLSTAVILLCMVSIVLGARRMVLDPFTVTQNLVVTLDSSLPTTGASSVTGSMIGGERDSVLYGVSGTLGNTVSSIVTGGSWHLACQRGADCKGSLTYDGKDSSSNLNFDGLGSVDFTFNRTKSLAFSVQADLDTFYNITVYESGSSGAKFATSRVSVPAGASQQFVIPFTTFVSSTGMDFSKVGSLVFFAEGAVDLDTSVSQFITFSNDVTGTVFKDCDGDGLKGSGESALAGVNVTLYDSVSTLPISSALTNVFGFYSIPTVPGSYYLCASPDTGVPTLPANNCTSTFSITGVNDYPNNNFGFTSPVVLSIPSDRTVSCTSSTAPAVTGTATATGCATPTISFVDVVTGSPCFRTISRTWTAREGTFVQTGVQKITVIDSTAPTFTTFPSDVTVQCTADTNPSSLGTPVATDSCSSASVSFSDSVSGSPCSRTITRNWNAADDCGNTARQVQTIRTTDTTAPTFTTFPSDVTVQCTADTNPSSLGTPVVTDSCSSATVSFFDSESGSPCSKTITRNWQGQDSCGNTINQAQTITSTDITAPTFTTFPSDVTVACGSNTNPSSLGTPVVTDSCSSATVSFFDSVSGSPCSRTITRNWQGQDSCGNSVRQVQTIRTTDTTAPTFTTFPSDVTVACGANTDPSSLGTPTGADSCTSAIVTFSDTTSPSCGSSLTRNWQVADECGNTQLRTQTITVQAPPPSPSPSPTGRPLGVSATATATPSPRPRPNIRIDASPPTLSEQSGLPFTFSVSRDGTTSVALSVVVLISGSADFNSDYSTSLTGANAGLNTFTIPVGSASSSFTFTPIDDLVRESDETISVQIQDSAAYVILSGGDLSVVTIIDNDATPIVSVRTDGVTSLTEGSGSTFVAVFDRSPSDSAFSLTFSLSGTAQLPGDFTVASGATSLSASQFRVDFAAGVSSASVAFPITNDGVPESNESIQVGIDLSASYDITTRFALFTIVDDDLDIPPVVSVVVTQPAGKALLENSTLSFVFEFRRDTSNLVNPLSISFTVGGSATFLSTASTDYTVVSGADTFSSTSGAITIPAGSSAKSIVIQPKNDANVEADETIILSVFGSTLYTISSTQGSDTAVITNDDGKPQVSVAISGVSTVTEGSGTVTFVFSRTGPVDRVLVVNFGITGTATFSSDYSLSGTTSSSVTSGSVSFNVGAATANVILSPSADVLTESKETVIFTVSSGSADYDAGTPSSATANINDKAPTLPVISITSVASSVAETVASTTIRIGRSGVLSGDVNVVIGITGTATVKTDYTLTPGVVSGGRLLVTVPSFSSSLSVTFKTINDVLVEGDETAIFTVTPQSSYIVDPSLSSRTITIVDNDFAKRDLHERNALPVSSASLLSSFSSFVTSILSFLFLGFF